MDRKKEQIVVSGLPRSGTSLMMQILEAGGIEAFTDDIRSADNDNPRGYFEWEEIKRIGQDHRILELVVGTGKAIKVISTLLPRLPKAHHYKIIFVQRDIDEVVRSQQKMLSARGEPTDIESLAETTVRLKNHNDQILQWMQTARHFESLIVDHRQLIKSPAHEIQKIISFLDRDIASEAGSMAAVVDPKLYRNRSKNSLVTRFTSWLR
ncbi:MAG: sulfotransferase domain-containing protein [Roseobacter sp.]|uniref:sulfotransferase domain-containing protein n=1 Tax=Parasphingorhabdus sp. TaxID=2709688 RepID=UPI003266CBAC